MIDLTAAIDWDAAFQKLYGRPAGKPAPPYLATLQAMGKDLIKLLEKQHKVIIRQVVIEATKAGLGDYLQYVFFVLNERPQEWPNLSPKQRAGLASLQDILSTTGGTPTYTGGLQVPPDDLEPAVDAALTELASWARMDFRKRLMVEYTGLAKKYMPALNRYITLDPKDDFSVTMVKALFEIVVEEHPNLFDQGHFLWSILVDLLR